jgi:hypothetical protein
MNEMNAMSDKEAMKLALEALQYDADYDTSVTMQKAAIYALEEALAKQEQGEPVAHINQNGVIHEVGYPWGIHNTLEPLYRHTPQQPSTIVRTAAEGEDTRRAWVGLTDDEKADIAAKGHQRWKEYAEAIEAKLKEKNSA